MTRRLMRAHIEESLVASIINVSGVTATGKLEAGGLNPTVNHNFKIILDTRLHILFLKKQAKTGFSVF